MATSARSSLAQPIPDLDGNKGIHPEAVDGRCHVDLVTRHGQSLGKLGCQGVAYGACRLGCRGLSGGEARKVDATVATGYPICARGCIARHHRRLDATEHGLAHDVGELAVLHPRRETHHSWLAVARIRWSDGVAVVVEQGEKLGLSHSAGSVEAALQGSVISHDANVEKGPEGQGRGSLAGGDAVVRDCVLESVAGGVVGLAAGPARRGHRREHDEEVHSSRHRFV